MPAIILKTHMEGVELCAQWVNDSQLNSFNQLLQYRLILNWSSQDFSPAWTAFLPIRLNLRKNFFRTLEVSLWYEQFYDVQDMIFLKTLVHKGHIRKVFLQCELFYDVPDLIFLKTFVHKDHNHKVFLQCEQFCGSLGLISV